MNLKDKNGRNTIGEIIELNLSHIDKIMALQEEVVNALDNKDLYFPSE